MRSDRHDAKRQGVESAQRVFQPALMQESMRTRIDGGGPTAQHYLVACHITSRFRLLLCDTPLSPRDAFCSLRRGLSPLPFCYLNARRPSRPEALAMPTPEQAASSLPDDPALLRIEGPIATITLNRPGSFNSTDLCPRKN